MSSEQQSAAEARSPEAVPLSDNVLAIDIGGSGVKAAVLDPEGDMTTERVRVATPHPCEPDALVEATLELVKQFEDYGRVSVGFPGVVRHGRIVTAPNLGTKLLKGFNLAATLEERLGRPVRVLNDADMQGLGAIHGEGVEMVVTLGTGFGTALFMDGELAPHLEIAHLPFRDGKTFDQAIGDRARRKIGRKKWNKRVQQAIEMMRELTHFDMLYLGGGNASKINFETGSDVRVVSNECGIKGGAWLWRSKNADRT